MLNNRPLFRAAFLALLVPVAAFPAAVKTTVDGQTIELTTCGRMAPDPLSKTDMVCAAPTSTFASQGVGGVFRFEPALTSTTKHTVKVIAMKGGAFADDRDITFQTGGRSGIFGMTLTPGDYDLQVVNKFNPSQVYFTTKIVVSPDTVGARAVDNTASGTGKLQVCREVDDDWKCVGESTAWKANEAFNLFVTLPKPAGVTLTKWVIHRQNADGGDGPFVDEQAQNIGEARFRKWATTEGFRLPPGTYTIYSIAATAAQSTEHSGNLQNYFAKISLTVR